MGQARPKFGRRVVHGWLVRVHTMLLGLSACLGAALLAVPAWHDRGKVDDDDPRLERKISPVAGTHPFFDAGQASTRPFDSTDYSPTRESEFHEEGDGSSKVSPDVWQYEGPEQCTNHIVEGDRVSILATGKIDLVSESGTPGRTIDTEHSDKELTFKVGFGEVLKGLDVGVHRLCTGAKARIMVPAELAFDDAAFRAQGEKLGVPKRATLSYVVEVRKIERNGRVLVESGEKHGYSDEAGIIIGGKRSAFAPTEPLAPTDATLRGRGVRERP